MYYVYTSIIIFCKNDIPRVNWPGGPPPSLLKAETDMEISPERWRQAAATTSKNAVQTWPLHEEGKMLREPHSIPPMEYKTT